MLLIGSTFCTASGAKAGDPLSEFCNDLETAPDEVLILLLHRYDLRSLHTRGPVAGTGRGDWSPVEFTRWNESRGLVP